MVTIIVPFYNSEHYLERCIQSVVNQTISDLQILLINDGSEDNSVAIAEKWQEKDSRIHVFNLPNNGVSFARNFGITKAVGEFLFLLDSDDWLATNTLEVLLYKQKEMHSDCVICGLKQSSGTVWAPSFEKHYEHSDEFNKDFTYWLNTELLSCSVNKLYKKELIKSLYPVDMSFAEDLVFCLNYLKGCERITFIPDPLYQHDVSNTSSITHTFNLQRFVDVELMQDALVDYGKLLHESCDISDKYIKDAIAIVRNFIKSPNYSNTEKRYRLFEWYKRSHMKNVLLRNCPTYKDKIILFCIKFRLFNLLNLIWNR